MNLGLCNVQVQASLPVLKFLNTLPSSLSHDDQVIAYKRYEGNFVLRLQDKQILHLIGCSSAHPPLALEYITYMVQTAHFSTLSSLGAH